MCREVSIPIESCTANAMVQLVGNVVVHVCSVQSGSRQGGIACGKVLMDVHQAVSIREDIIEMRLVFLVLIAREGGRFFAPAVFVGGDPIEVAGHYGEGFVCGAIILAISSLISRLCSLVGI